MKIESGHILTPSQASSGQCSVCGGSLNLKADKENASPFATGYTAEHCGRLYSFSVETVRADIGRTQLNQDEHARQLAAEKAGYGNPPQELVDNQKAALQGADAMEKKQKQDQKEAKSEEDSKAQEEKRLEREEKQQEERVSSTSGGSSGKKK